MGKLDGKVAIVAGSSRGIGKGIAIAYAREGAKVAVVARTETPGRIEGTIGQTAEQIQAEGGTVLAVRCDITEEEDVDAMVQKVLAEWGTIDIMLNSGAVILYTKIIDTTFKRWELIHRVNLHGSFLLSRAVLPHMIEKRSGNIIQLTSGGAYGTGGGHYGSTKAGLERFCAALAAEVKEYNIPVNCLNPGAVKTEGAVFGRPADFDWSTHVTPIECGPVAIYMANQTAGAMTGVNINRTEYKEGSPVPAWPLAQRPSKSITLQG